MKKLFTLVILCTALVGKTMAWDNLFNKRTYVATSSERSNKFISNNEVPWLTDGNHNYGDRTWYAYGNITNFRGVNGGVTWDYTTNNEEEQGGALVQIIRRDNGTSDYYVITIPYKKHVWDFTEQLNPNLVQDGNTYGYSFRSIAQNGNTKNGPVAYVKSAINQDNALYINETAGLLFTTPANSFGRNLTGPAKDRDYTYNDITGCKTIAYKGNGDNENTKLVFPQVPAGYYIKMYWHQYDAGFGSDYTMSNLKDLEGNAINTSHKLRIPGCPTNTNGDYYGYGTTTFQVQNTGNVTFNLRDIGWATLYKIEITSDYSSDMQLEEYPAMNESTGALSGTPTIVGINTDAGHIVTIGNTPAVRYYSGVVGDAHGLAAMSPELSFVVEGEGKQNVTSITSEPKTWRSNGGVDYTNYKLTVNPGYGNVKATQKIIISYPDQSYKYVLDKQETWIAVGHVDPQTYPYTWDFTDYNMSDDRAGWAGTWTYIHILDPREIKENNNGNVDDVNFKWFGSWKFQGSNDDNKNGIYVMQDYYGDKGSNAQNIDKPLFAQGSQLAYAIPGDGASAQKPFNGYGAVDEYIGLGVKCEAINSENPIHILGRGNGHLWNVQEILIPNVTNDMRIYIQTDEGGTPSIEVANGTAANDDAAKGSSTLAWKKELSTITENTFVKGWIISTTEANGTNVKLTFPDVSKKIYRIGVTNITKAINQFGYATESRDVEIDHMMTGFLTKANAHAYFVKNFTAYDNVPTGQDPIGKVQMVPAVETKELSKEWNRLKFNQDFERIPPYMGVVLYADNVSSKITVPLFYPPCNSVEMEDGSIGNLLKPSVTSTSDLTKELDGKGKDYILTNVYQYTKDLSKDITDGTSADDIGFYRAQQGTLGEYKSYLCLDGVTTSYAKLVLFSFFDDEEEDIHNGIATGISEAALLNENGQINENAEWYNLNGQKLNGMPSSSGLYIVNGKKVMIK